MRVMGSILKGEEWKDSPKVTQAVGSGRLNRGVIERHLSPEGHRLKYTKITIDSAPDFRDPCCFLQLAPRGHDDDDPHEARRSREMKDLSQ
jgi:hypothetical protein